MRTSHAETTYPSGVLRTQRGRRTCA